LIDKERAVELATERLSKFPHFTVIEVREDGAVVATVTRDRPEPHD
jgi:hypothetical protein